MILFFVIQQQRIDFLGHIDGFDSGITVLVPDMTVNVALLLGHVPTVGASKSLWLHAIVSQVVHQCLFIGELARAIGIQASVLFANFPPTARIPIASSICKR